MTNQPWGVEYWGPNLAATWRSIQDRKKVAVTSFDFDKLPESIGRVPCVLNMLTEPVDISYSQGEASTAYWRGESHFHLSMDVSKTRFNYIFQFYQKIVEAAAKSLTLGGKIETFILTQKGSIRPALLNYGGSTDHLGLVVPWEVLESLSGKFTVGI